jgi:hypothetical protein
VEQWRENGFLVQENDLTYTGGTMRLGLQVSMFLFDSLRVVPRLGGTVSVDEYTRDNFLFLVEDATLFRLERNVVETIVTAGPTAGVHLSFQVTDSVSVQLDTELAWLTFAEADNDGFNISIDAEEGWNWVGEVTLAKKLSRPGHQIGVSVIAEVTEIEGSVLITPEQVFEYPDNTLEEIMMEVFWSASF